MKRSLAPLASALSMGSMLVLGACSSSPLGGEDAGMSCSYADVARAPGSSFPSEDGCNTCTCRPDGQVACTLIACGADAGGAAGAAGGVAACGGGAPTDHTAGWVFFDSDRDNFNRDIYAIRPDGSGLTRVTSAPGIDKEPAISSDGRWMAFTSDRGGSMQIYLMDRQGGAVTPLTNVVEGAQQASFSHDGSLIAFRGGNAVYTIRPDGSGRTLVTFRPNDASAFSWPRFAVGDQQLVVDRQNEIDAAFLDSTGFRMIVQNWTTTIRAPSVSPAGGEVVYYAFCGTGAVSDKGTSLWTTPFATTTNPCAGRRVTPPSEPDSEHPAWGPGDAFAYERIDRPSNVASIALIARAAGSTPCLLTPDLADNRNPTWSP